MLALTTPAVSSDILPVTAFSSAAASTAAETSGGRLSGFCFVRAASNSCAATESAAAFRVAAETAVSRAIATRSATG